MRGYELTERGKIVIALLLVIVLLLLTVAILVITALGERASQPPEHPGEAVAETPGAGLISYVISDSPPPQGGG